MGRRRRARALAPVTGGARRVPLRGVRQGDQTRGPGGSGERPRRAPKTGASDRIGADRISAYHDYTRTKGVNWVIYFVAGAPPAGLPDLVPAEAAREGARARRRRSDHRLQSPQLPGPLRARDDAPLATADALRRQGRAVRAGLAGLDPQPARRLSGSKGRGGRRDARDLPPDPRARRRPLHLPRGDPDQTRLARGSAPRRRPAGAGVGRGGPAGRRPRVRARPRRLEDPPSPGPDASRQVADLPADREPVAVAGGDRDYADLAEHRTAVGMARGPAADAQGGRDRRRQLGHRGRSAAGPRRRRGPARLPDRRAGGRGGRQPRELLSARDHPRRLDHRQRAADIEVAGLDLVCLAVPSASLPAAVGALSDRIGSRTAVLLLSKGLVPPLGTLPGEYVDERIRSRRSPRSAVRPTQGGRLGNGRPRAREPR